MLMSVYLFELSGNAAKVNKSKKSAKNQLLTHLLVKKAWTYLLYIVLIKVCISVKNV